MISIFTPTHDPQFLLRAEASLRDQTCQDFEWVIVPNGPVRAADIKVTLPQARVIDYEGKSLNIGALKKFACEKCKGDILLEFDHDDELAPTALAEVAAAFFHYEDAGFIFSNCCEVRDGKPFSFSEEFGWRYRPCGIRGTQHLEAIAFPPDPASLSKIWYAPNHLRAWRRNFYMELGGHNIGMAVLDDQELMLRTYLKGQLHHINLPLYIYHYHTGNSFAGEKNREIQEGTLRLHDEYIERLVLRWCELQGYMSVDLCSGEKAAPGYTSGADKRHKVLPVDLDDAWPYADNSVGLFRAQDALEHLKDPIHVMKEAYRCLVPGGWFLTRTPSTDGRGAFQDPTHVSFWNSNSFWYYTKSAYNKFIDCPVRFQLNRIQDYYPSGWHKAHNIPYVWADLRKATTHMCGSMEI